MKKQPKKVTKSILKGIIGIALFAGLSGMKTLPVQAADYVYNIVDFGADGTDNEKDDAAIQKALDYASEYYTIEVYVPAGTYYISKTLCIQSNTTLRLDKDATIIRNKKGVNKYMLISADEEHMSDFYGKYDLAHDVVVTGGTWNGGDTSKATSTSNLLYFGHSERISIQNTTIRNCYGNHAIEFAGVRDSEIKNCNITGFRYESDYFTSEAIQLDICYKDAEYGEWAPGFKTDKTPCKNITIKNNIITDYPRGVGVHHYLKNKYCSDIMISKNKFLRSSEKTQYKCSSAVFMEGVRNVTMKSNIVDHYYYGALLKLCKNMTVKSNKFKGTSVCGIIMDGCDRYNARRWFSITIKKKKFKIVCPYINKGTVTTLGKVYSFKTKDGKVTIKLPKKPKKGQMFELYGKDAWNNKYYRTFYR